MDHNEHVINRPLGKALANKEGPDLRKAIVQYTGTSPGAMFFQGKLPIDGLWVLGDLDVSNACVMPFGYGIGDHRAFILDIPLKLLAGVDPVKIVCPAGQQLNSKLPSCSEYYIASFQGNITRHQLLERLHKAHTREYSAEEWARRVVSIDEEGKMDMQRAEKTCRKIKRC